MKKLFLTLALLAMAISSLWANDFEVNGIYYNITDETNKTVAVASNGEYSGSVVIPERVYYNGTTYSVTSIGYRAFYACTGLTSVTIPNSVTSIGGYAFFNCSGLTEVIIPKNVTEIGEAPFAWCIDLTEIVVATDNPNYCSVDGVLFNKDKTELVVYPAGKSGDNYFIPNSVTSIGDYAFYICAGLTEVTIPNSVTSIGNNAFSDCSGLTSVTIPNSVTSIGGVLSMIAPD